MLTKKLFLQITNRYFAFNIPIQNVSQWCYGMILLFPCIDQILLIAHRNFFFFSFKGNQTSGSCLSERLVVPLHQTLRYKHEAALSGRGLMNGAFCSVSHLVHCTARGGRLAWLPGKCAVFSPTCTSELLCKYYKNHKLNLSQ